MSNWFSKKQFLDLASSGPNHELNELLEEKVQPYLKSANSNVLTAPIVLKPQNPDQKHGCVPSREGKCIIDSRCDGEAAVLVLEIKGDDFGSFDNVPSFHVKAHLVYPKLALKDKIHGDVLS
ncbi:hypothetical protein SDJN02_13645, partial [Cucurbita argyrosperma subsp. argyrosperma]